jgi:hypothetical protein
MTPEPAASPPESDPTVLRALAGDRDAEREICSRLQWWASSSSPLVIRAKWLRGRSYADEAEELARHVKKVAVEGGG